ncbi:uncharacterized protein LOC144881449 [Branchiostoma floridae x Branchiostoma japonicum]
MRDRNRFVSHRRTQNYLQTAWDTRVADDRHQPLQQVFHDNIPGDIVLYVEADDKFCLSIGTRQLTRARLFYRNRTVWKKISTGTSRHVPGDIGRISGFNFEEICGVQNSRLTTRNSDSRSRDCRISEQF